MEEALEVGQVGARWSVERRFRVTEVFLAVLWVGILFLRLGDYGNLGCMGQRGEIRR
jgi:hypothetical protein